MKNDEEIMNILEAYDLTRCHSSAAELAGCDRKTVVRIINKRDVGTLGVAPSLDRSKLIDDFAPKLEEWIDASKGKLRADVAHDKLRAMGYTGSERTTRRAVAAARQAWQKGHRRVHRPWVPEPGLFFQFDYGDGPLVAGTKAVLFCAWLAWSRFRVVIPIRDKTLPTVIGAIDTALRRFEGCPTYGLTDNERTVTIDHVARIPVRNPEMVAAATHYGLTVLSCVPADPASKGGSESTVKLAKADLVPTEANLLAAYESWESLEAACEAFCEEVNGRVHRVTRRVPAEMLTEERPRLHALPAHPYVSAFGVARVVGIDSPMVQFDWCLYSAPFGLAGEAVWVRVEATKVVITHVGPAGPREVARHELTTPGNPRIDPAHFPPAPETPLNRTPVAKNPAEAEFLAIGTGAALWLTEAAATGVTRIRAKMAEAVTLAKLVGAVPVDLALNEAALCGRFGEGDVEAIVSHQASARPGPARQAGEAHSLQPGTASWESFGR